MRMENIEDKVIEADVLVIGGGVAGCFAAIKAAEAGSRVVLWEKAVVGTAFGPSIWIGLPPRELERPETNEAVLDTVLKLTGLGFSGGPKKVKGCYDEVFNVVLIRDGWDRVHDLERWGVNMRWHGGEYNLLLDPMTGMRSNLRLSNQDFKKQLAEAVVKSGVEVYERTMGIDLLTRDGTVVGATGLNIRTGQFIVCKASATIICTTLPGRITEGGHGADSGDGMAMAIRAGAEVVNMEMPWIDRVFPLDPGADLGAIMHIRDLPIVNARGEKVGEIALRFPDWLKEEMAGRGPCYLDTTGLSEEQYRFFEEERELHPPSSSRRYKIRGFDLRTTKWELGVYFPVGLSHWSGILIGVDTKTNVKGLFAAGGCCGSVRAFGLPHAAVLGGIAGVNAAKYAADSEKPTVAEAQVQTQKEPVFALLKVKAGVPPLELQMKLWDIMEKYSGIFRSEGRINQGIWRLRSVRDKFFPEMKATTPHTLMKCQEVRNLYLVGEMRLVSSSERKEGGIGFYRQDYPELADAPWEKAIIARLEDGEIKLSRRKMPELREEVKK